jgi:VanZ family protein
VTIRKDPATAGSRFGSLLALTVALILYGSTYPWDFVDRIYIENPLWLLLHTWPASMNVYMFRDVFLNLAVYVPVGVFGYLKLAEFFGPVVSAAVTIAGGAALSASVEMLQEFQISRYSSAVDLVSNIAGTAAGVALGRMHRSTLARWARTTIAPGAEARGALLLLVLWMGYQLVPLFPVLSAYRLSLEIRSLFQPGSFGLTEFLAVIAEWLVVARLLEALSAGLARARFTTYTLAILMLLVPLRLVIAGRTATLSELSAVATAWILWTAWLSKQTHRTQWTAGLALAAIAIRGLGPLEFGPNPRPFSWIPFAGSLSYDYAVSAIPLLRKSFIYGAALWLLNASGVNRLRAALGVAAMLAAIEAAQMYLPVHTPESTDPLLALLLAGGLRLLNPPPRQQ